MTVCAREGCEETFEQPRSGRRRKWCSGKCRKVALYAGSCVDCGAPTNGYDGPGKASRRCLSCSSGKAHSEAVERIIADIRHWHALFGMPPTATEWNQHAARANVKHASDCWGRAIARYESTGRGWPATSAMQRVFGSFTAAIQAAGFEPIKSTDRWIGARGLELREEDRAA